MIFSMRLLTALLLSVTLPVAARCQIQRLDNSTLSFAEADSFARKTLADHHVTGAEIAILNHGRQNP